MKWLNHSISYWNRMYHSNREQNNTSFSNKLRCIKFATNEDLACKRSVLNSIFNLDWQIYWCIVGTKCRGGWASSIFISTGRFEELKWITLQLNVTAVRFATPKLRHYFLAHPVNLVTRSNLLRYLLSRLMMSGRTAWWLLQLNESISVITPKGLRSQALSNLIARFPSGNASLCMNSYFVKKFVPWKQMNGVLLSKVHPHTKEEAQGLSYRIQMVLIFRNSPVPIT